MWSISVTLVTVLYLGPGAFYDLFLKVRCLSLSIYVPYFMSYHLFT